MFKVGSVRIKVKPKDGSPDRYVCAMVRALAWTLENRKVVSTRSDDEFALPDGCEFQFDNALNALIFKELIHGYLPGFAWVA